jgi:YaiO family outer membrane protein
MCKYSLHAFLSVTVLLFLNIAISAQGKIAPDSMMILARKAAFEEKNYPAAIVLAKQVLKSYPTDADVLVFTGRVYTWSKIPDSARVYFRRALILDPVSEDAYAAYADLEYWGKNYDEAIRLVNAGLSNYPQSQQLKLKKGKILLEQLEYAQASTVAREILAKDGFNLEAMRLINRIGVLATQNSIGVRYDYTGPGKRITEPWHLVSIEYNRRGKIPFSARVNYGSRFGLNGVQMEADAYPKLGRQFYTYLNFGIAQKNGVFPQWRAGFSLMGKLPRAFEAELGMRYLHFSAPVYIYTAFLGKYAGNWLFGARMFLTPGESRSSYSYNGLVRLYFASVDDYVYLTAGAGFSPDHPLNNIRFVTENLNTFRGSAGLRKSLGFNLLSFEASLISQEYMVGQRDRQFQLSAGYARKF